jgi:hypothetical protein
MKQLYAFRHFDTLVNGDEKKGIPEVRRGTVKICELVAVLPLTEQDMYRFNIFQTCSAGTHSLLFKGYRGLSPQG